MIGPDFGLLREKMVDQQLVPRGISDTGVLAAFRKVPRHRFISGKETEDLYGDFPLPIGDGQTISQPYMVALMTELLNLKRNDRVLEIGTGSGYQTAILAELTAEVYTIERFPNLARRAEEVLAASGYANIKIKTGDGTLGWKEHAPFDAIIVTAGSPEIPKSLLDQLKEGGSLVIPVGGQYSQMLTRATKQKGKIKASSVCACVFVPLVGAEAWKGE